MNTRTVVGKHLTGPSSLQARINAVMTIPGVKAFEAAAKRDREMFRFFDVASKLDFPAFNLASTLKFPVFADLAKVKSLSAYPAQASHILGGLGPFKTQA